MAEDFKTRLSAIKTYLSENGDIDGQDAMWLIDELEDKIRIIGDLSSQVHELRVQSLFNPLNQSVWPIDRDCDE